MAGRQPPELTAKHLKRFDNLPLDWDQQRKALGFPAVAPVRHSCPLHASPAAHPSQSTLRCKYALGSASCR